MTAEELRQKTSEELAEELVGLRREQFNLRMQRATGEMARHSEYGRVKKDIARIKTVMNEQKRAAAKAQSSSSNGE